MSLHWAVSSKFAQTRSAVECFSIENFSLSVYNSLLHLYNSWFSYMASIALVQKSQGSTARTISILTVLGMVPSLLLYGPGGIIADTRDRRKVLVARELLNAVLCCSLFVLSNRLLSVPLMLVTTVLREVIDGLASPSNSAIRPMIVSEIYLHKATVTYSMIWSITAALSPSLSGWCVERLGIEACFFIEAATLFVSGACLFLIKGNYRVESEDTDQAEGALLTSEEPLDRSEETMESGSSESAPAYDAIEISSQASSTAMIWEAINYLFKSPLGPFVLVETCGTFLYGSTDVVSAGLAEVNGVVDNKRMGWLFSAEGVGCLIGPLLVDFLWKSHREGKCRAWQIASVWSLGVMGLGSVAMGVIPNYWSRLIWNVIRASGETVVDNDTSLILQATTPPYLLGRVMAVYNMTSTISEAFSALVAGFFIDKGTITTAEFSTLLGVMGLVMFGAWLLYLAILTPEKVETELVVDEPGLETRQHLSELEVAPLTRETSNVVGTLT